MRVSTEVTRKKPSSRRRRVKIVFVIVIPGYGCVTRPSKQCCRGDAGDRHSVVMLYLSLLQVPLADDKIAARRSFASGRRRRRCATREPGQTTHTHFAHASLQLCVTKRPTTNQTRARPYVIYFHTFVSCLGHVGGRSPSAPNINRQR